MKRKNNALKYFRSKFNCSQSVLAVFGPEYGISENDCLKIACAFGGGMGRQQHTCGAVTGALMVLGLRYGKGLDDTEDRKEFTYLKTREFFSEFVKLNSYSTCLDLLNGLKMNDPADHQKIKDLKLFDIKCEKYLSDAVEIVERIL
jgi:C_GCAxxG_C_C family probable redox protein